MAEIIDTPLNDNIVSDIPEQDNIEITDLQTIREHYEGINTDSTDITIDNTYRTISVSLKQNQYSSKLAFPSVGSDKLLYVDLSDNSIWRFDMTNSVYVCVGRNYKEIDVINGGSANV